MRSTEWERNERCGESQEIGQPFARSLSFECPFKPGQGSKKVSLFAADLLRTARLMSQPPKPTDCCPWAYWQQPCPIGGAEIKYSTQYQVFSAAEVSAAFSLAWSEVISVFAASPPEFDSDAFFRC